MCTDSSAKPRALRNSIKQSLAQEAGRKENHPNRNSIRTQRYLRIPRNSRKSMAMLPSLRPTCRSIMQECKTARSRFMCIRLFSCIRKCIPAGYHSQSTRRLLTCTTCSQVQCRHSRLAIRHKKMGAIPVHIHTPNNVPSMSTKVVHSHPFLLPSCRPPSFPEWLRLAVWVSMVLDSHAQYAEPCHLLLSIPHHWSY
jgi:hypothetical protein